MMAVRTLAVPALLLLYPTAILGQACPGQGFGIGSCLAYEMLAGCSGNCSFVQDGSTCNILADSSKCPSGNSTDVMECTCDSINSQEMNFCFNCGATIVENEDGSTSTITVIDATPTSQSAKPVELGMPVATGPCADEFNALLKCYGSSLVSEGEGSPCASFEPVDLYNEQPLPTTCAEANDIICSSGLLVGCCNDEIVAIAECLAGVNAGVVDCDVNCGGPTSSAYNKLGAAASMAGAAATLVRIIISLLA